MASGDTGGDVEGVRQAVQRFMDIYNSGDMEGLATKVYLPDCVVMPPNGPTTHGSALKELYSKSGVTRYILENDDILVEGDMAVTRDHFTGYLGDGTVAAKGNSLMVWMKKDGVWFCKFDMFTAAV